MIVLGTICTLMFTLSGWARSNAAQNTKITPPPGPAAGSLVTMREAAELLKVSPVTIKRWLKQGRLRAYHVGPRAIRIKQEDLQALLTPTNVQDKQKEVSTGMLQLGKQQHRRPWPAAEELARRQRLIAVIRMRREQRVITPHTAEELVREARMAREKGGSRAF